ncbi:MAG TPA: carboxypeptidase-like regulatory domain-containing protein, partial [Candidatus Sulfotelmatobacter sp.]
MHLVRIALYATCLILPLAAFAAVVGSVHGVIHDPQHHPVPNAMVMIKAKSSDWSASTNSDANGNFAFNAVPLG